MFHSFEANISVYMFHMSLIYYFGKQLHGNCLFCHFRLLDLLFHTALVSFTALTCVLVTFFAGDRSYCGCGKNARAI